MIDSVPQYVSVTFVLTTFLTVGILCYAIQVKNLASRPANLAFLMVAFWLVFQAVLSITGFFLDTTAVPPRFPLIAVPTLFFIAFLFVFYREAFIEQLPLRVLTVIHIVRIPVEIVLWWLYQADQVPRLMTFEGRNFDILAGFTAPLIAWLAFRQGKINRPLLVIWNIVCLILLTNIVVNAILSVPGPIQQFAFDQPNRAVLNFPFVWLPAIIVPIVLFSHLTSLWQLFGGTPQKT
ncbi:MAG: hypothetical protein HKN25_08155 [Pyrinomonadaceae bacterium]|nr:hypothetical protein [Pyrinomonadaceae bacterium]